MYVERPSDEPSDAADPVSVGVTRVGDWFRLLRGVLLIVVPTAVAGVFITATPTRGNTPSAEAIIAIVMNLIVHTCFWVSLAYAYIDWRERTGEVRVSAPPTLALVDRSAAIKRVFSPTRRVSLGEVLGPIAIWISIVAFVFGQRRIAPLNDAGVTVPVLDGGSWPRWTPLAAWMAANVAAALIATFRMGRWTPATTLVSVGASLLVASEVIRSVATGAWISEAYLQLMETTAEAQRRLEQQLVAATLVIVIGTTVWTTVIALRGWRRDRSAPALSYD